MVAHYHGGVWNSSDVARSLGVSPPTTQHYLDILTGAFAVRQLPPWFEKHWQAPGEGVQGLHPRLTKSMHVALNDLHLDQLFVVYPGTQSYELSRGVVVLPLPMIDRALAQGLVRAPQSSRMTFFMLP